VDRSGLVVVLVEGEEVIRMDRFSLTTLNILEASF
jgi:hypothetical protein